MGRRWIIKLYRYSHTIKTSLLIQPFQALYKSTNSLFSLLRSIEIGYFEKRDFSMHSKESKYHGCINSIIIFATYYYGLGLISSFTIILKWIVVPFWKSLYKDWDAVCIALRKVSLGSTNSLLHTRNSCAGVVSVQETKHWSSIVYFLRVVTVSVSLDLL